MVHHHQRVVIDVVRFPQLGGDTQIVIAVSRHKLAARNLYPFFGLINTLCLASVDADAHYRAPRGTVLHKVHSPTVESEQGRARALKALIDDDRLIGAQIELRLGSSIWPYDAQHV